MFLSDETIKNAIDNGWYTCHYQPKVEPSFEKVTGVEALFRLEIPGEGIIAPALFIERAIQIGYEEQIFFIVLERSLQEMQVLRCSLNLAINITHNVIVNDDNLSRIKSLLEQYSFPAKRLILELSESDELSPKLSQHIDQYKALGVQISIDDFGSGYSNINKVMSLPIDELKFDKSLIDSTNKRASLLIKSIVKYCKEMGIKTVAEGVEDAETRIFVRNLGFDSYQGFYYSKPVSVQELQAASL